MVDLDLDSRGLPMYYIIDWGSFEIKNILNSIINIPNNPFIYTDPETRGEDTLYI